MGCGGVKDRGAGSPRLRTEDTPEVPGKLPLLVLEGWAHLFGIPLKNPYKRSHPPPHTQHLNKPLVANVEFINLHSNVPVSLRKDTSLSSVIRVDSCNPHPVGDAGNSEAITYEVSHPSSVPGPQQENSVVTPMSPMAPLMMPEESDDEEGDVGGKDESLRKDRMEKEREAESQAAEFAAAQREAAERLLAEQSSAIGVQKSQADAILSKYA